jgi:hypothetical protein
VKLAEHYRVQLIWVGNERADELTKLGAEYPLTGSEPSYGISAGIAKKTVGLDKQRI